MRSKKLSASSIDTYLRCPHGYYLKYHTDKKPTQLKEDFHLHFGIVIHKALEIYKNLEYRNRDKGINILKCLHRAEKDYDKYTFSSSEFEEAQEMLENWIDTRDTRSEEYSLVSTEEYFKIEIKDFYIHGYIDCIEKSDDNHYRVRDYKTGNTHKNKREVMDSIQLKMYALAVMDTYDVENVEVAFDQLRFEKPEFIQYTTDQLRRFVQYLYHIQRLIKNDNEHKPRIGWHCRWCDYSNHCEYINDIDYMTEEEVELIRGDFNQLVALYNDYKEKAKKADHMAGELKKLITQEMEKRRIDEYESKNYSLTKTHSRLKRVDFSQVFDKVPPEIMDDVFSVKIKELEKIIEPEDIEYRIVHSNPYLRVSQKQPDEVE